MNSNMANSMKGRSILIILRCEGKGQISAVTPRMRATLAMFEPATLPMASPEDPIHAACVDTSNSGIDVPKPTTVMPMTIALSFARCAIATAPSIKKSPPFIRRTKPRMMYKMLSHIIFVNRLQSYGLIPNKETKQRKNKNNGGKVDSLISNQRYFDKFLRND